MFGNKENGKEAVDMTMGSHIALIMYTCFSSSFSRNLLPLLLIIERAVLKWMVNACDPANNINLEIYGKVIWSQYPVIIDLVCSYRISICCFT